MVETSCIDMVSYGLLTVESGELGCTTGAAKFRQILHMVSFRDWHTGVLATVVMEEAKFTL